MPKMISVCYYFLYVVFLQTAIPVLIGTKFDDFIQLPIDLQWTIASEVNIPIFLLKNFMTFICKKRKVQLTQIDMEYV